MSLLIFVALSLSAQLGSYSRFQISTAQADGITSAEYERCTNKALSNSDAVQCIAEERNNIDRQLNAEYRATLARMPNSRGRERLRVLQRKWLRDTDTCSVENAGGHTPYELAVHQCEIDELIRRVAWLRQLARP